MRIEIGISAAAHAAILVASVVGLPSAEAYKIDEPLPLPVEIFTVDEFTQLAGKKTEAEPVVNSAAVEKEPEPEVIPEPVRTPPEPVEAEKPPAKVAALEPPPEPEPVELAEPEPLPLPEPVAAPEPEPEPVAEPEPAPLPLPEPEPETAEAPPPPSVKAPAPSRKPTLPKTAEAPPKPEPPKQAKPQPPKQQAKKKEFNPDKIAALLNKVQDNAGPKAPAAAGRADDGARDVSGLDLVVTQSEMRYLQSQMQRCWNPPVAVNDAASLNVRVEVQFTREGRLEGTPVVLNSGGEGFDVAANAAVRAVAQCQPYDMPAEKYDNWQQVIVNFDPRFMLGG